MLSTTITQAYHKPKAQIPLTRLIRTYLTRANTRAALARLNDAHLDDIGLNYKQAIREARKPFFL